jgi:hypothetical protein
MCIKRWEQKNCSNYQVLCASNSTGRVYNKVIKMRLEKEILDAEEQNGFRAGKSCADCIFRLKQVIDKRLAYGFETHMVFIALRKAYDCVPLNKLWQVTEEQEVKKQYTGAVKNLYSNMASSIKAGQHVSQNPISPRAQEMAAT